MAMETKQTSGTRDLVGDTERDESRGRFDRDDESRASRPRPLCRRGDAGRRGTAREDDTRRGGAGTLDRDDDDARGATT